MTCPQRCLNNRRLEERRQASSAAAGGGGNEGSGLEQRKEGSTTRSCRLGRSGYGKKFANQWLHAAKPAKLLIKYFAALPRDIKRLRQGRAHYRRRQQRCYSPSVTVQPYDLIIKSSTRTLQKLQSNVDSQQTLHKRGKKGRVTIDPHNLADCSKLRP
jgi:hypothetical protein